jgi:tetratricopeptide (TPR) repeat protein
MSSDSKARILREAEKYVFQGKLQHAIAEYSKIIQEDPNDLLTMNTIGDLCLRLGLTEAANRTFSEVAENYCKNNFLLKAIAVYKKILKSEPESLEINTTMASLYVRQGLSVDARNQYLRVAEMLERGGRGQEALEAYEKAAELDPSHTPVQIKLASKCLAAGDTAKAKMYLASAARAQVKAGKISNALDLFRQAAKLDPSDVEIIRSVSECSETPQDLNIAIELLKSSVALVPNNASLHEILGHSYLGVKDLENAAESFQKAAFLDENLYEGFLALSKACLAQGDLDRAANCLDPIIPTLISHRETERAVTACGEILKIDPAHVPALKSLAIVHSATNDKTRYLETLDKLVDKLLDQKEAQEALEYLEKILREVPLSNKHLLQHRRAFSEAFPEAAYKPFSPTAKEEEAVAAESDEESESPKENADGAALMVEIDLLMNYGMREKARALLQDLETEDPYDLGVHSRLLSVYRDDNDNEKAAEQSLLMAALYCKQKDEKSLRKCMADARKLSPALIDSVNDLSEFAWQRGIKIQKTVDVSGDGGLLPTVEVDLSQELSKAFLTHGAENAAFEEAVATASGVSSTSMLSSGLAGKTASKTVEEQLEEVDFYIRLGFEEEARATLDEIAAANPEHPELAARYAQLSPETGKAATAVSAPASEETENGKIEILDADEHDLDWNLDSNQTPEPVAEESQVVIGLGPGELRAEDSGAHIPAPADDRGMEFAAESSALSSEGPTNELFADLLAEIEVPEDQETTWEDFENHFGLGIAYREMDLVEDAIKEFQGAVKALDTKKHPREIIQCCGMLSNCFLQKGMPRSAIRWCQAGLNIPEISQHEAMALKYDMGAAHSLAGNPDGALEWYGEIFGVDSGYRDVAQKIDNLKGNPVRHDTGDAKA